MFSLESIPSDHPTPSLLIDAKTVRRNIDAMQSYCNQNGLALRPHTKTHKSLLFANWQLRAGAKGLTVAKGGEAAKMSEVCNDIFLAYPAIGSARLRMVTTIARENKIRIGIDSREAATLLSIEAAASGVVVEILVDVDVGFHRTGVPSVEDAVSLASYIDGLPGLQLRGIMCFPGHLTPKSSSEDWISYADFLGEVIQRFRLRGLCCDVVSGGSTPTATLSERNPWLTEIRPGTYVFNDVNELRLNVAMPDDCAARVLATVVSRTHDRKFVVDAGSKTLSSDRCGPAPESGYGVVVEFDDARIVRLSEEHGEIELSNSTAPPVGERVTIIPNHICVCVNLQNSFWLYDDNEWVEHRVDARGLLV